MRVTVILVEPMNEGNIGAVARIMKNFGVDELRLVNPLVHIDEEARRRAVHANNILASTRIYETLKQALDGVDLVVGTTARLARDYKVTRTAITPRQLSDICLTEHGVIGVVFGRESSGLTNDELAFANIIVSIPTSPEYSSLNLSHAVSILLYELFISSSKHPLIKELSTREEKDLLVKYVDQITPYLQLPPYRRRVIHRVFENLIGRAILSRREANTLLGLFRRIIVALGMRTPCRPATDILVDDAIQDHSPEEDADPDT